MNYQESDRAYYDRSVSLRNRLLRGIDNGLKLAQKRGYQHVRPEETVLEPFICLSPAPGLPSTGKLGEFVDQIYEGVNVRIKRVEAGLSFIGIQVEPTEKVEGMFETGARLGILPIMSREVALSAHIYIFPNTIPMTYGVQEFTLSDWIKSGILPRNSTFDRREVDLDVVEAIVSPIPGATFGFRKTLSTLFKRKGEPTTPTFLVAEFEGVIAQFRSPFREELYL